MAEPIIGEEAVRVDGDMAESLLIPAALSARLTVRLGKRAKITL
jgi:hypothetical protein